MRGDFGRSYSNRQDIAKSIAPRLKNTLYLAAMAAIIAVPLSILLGILCVLYVGTWVDRTIGIVTLSAISLPEFFAGYLLIAYFSVSHFWLPSSATVSDAMPWGIASSPCCCPA